MLDKRSNDLQVFKVANEKLNITTKNKYIFKIKYFNFSDGTAFQTSKSAQEKIPKVETYRSRFQTSDSADFQKVIFSFQNVTNLENL